MFVCREWRETISPLPVWIETLPKGKLWWPFLVHSWLRKTHQHIFCTASLFLNNYGSLLFPETGLPSKVSCIKTWQLQWHGQNKIRGWPLYLGVHLQPVIKTKCQTLENSWTKVDQITPMTWNTRKTAAVWIFRCNVVAIFTLKSSIQQSIYWNLYMSFCLLPH